MEKQTYFSTKGYNEPQPQTNADEGRVVEITDSKNFRNTVYYKVKFKADDEPEWHHFDLLNFVKNQKHFGDFHHSNPYKPKHKEFNFLFFIQRKIFKVKSIQYTLIQPAKPISASLVDIQTSFRIFTENVTDTSNSDSESRSKARTQQASNADQVNINVPNENNNNNEEIPTHINYYKTGRKIIYREVFIPTFSIQQPTLTNEIWLCSGRFNNIQTIHYKVKWRDKQEITIHYINSAKNIVFFFHNTNSNIHYKHVHLINRVVTQGGVRNNSANATNIYVDIELQHVSLNNTRYHVDC